MHIVATIKYFSRYADTSPLNNQLSTMDLTVSRRQIKDIQ